MKLNSLAIHHASIIDCGPHFRPSSFLFPAAKPQISRTRLSTPTAISFLLSQNKGEMAPNGGVWMLQPWTTFGFLFYIFGTTFEKGVIAKFTLKIKFNVSLNKRLIHWKKGNLFFLINVSSFRQPYSEDDNAAKKPWHWAYERSSRFRPIFSPFTRKEKHKLTTKRRL